MAMATHSELTSGARLSFHEIPHNPVFYSSAGAAQSHSKGWLCRKLLIFFVNQERLLICRVCELMRGANVSDADKMLDRLDPGAMQVPSFQTPAMARAIELARELLRQRGYSEEAIEEELNKPPGSGVARP